MKKGLRLSLMKLAAGFSERVNMDIRRVQKNADEPLYAESSHESTELTDEAGGAGQTGYPAPAR